MTPTHAGHCTSAAADCAGATRRGGVVAVEWARRDLSSPPTALCEGVFCFCNVYAVCHASTRCNGVAPDDQEPDRFVVGAGASCEIGLPTGAVLQGQIGHFLRTAFSEERGQYFSDLLIRDAVNRWVQSPQGPSKEACKKAAQEMCEALPIAASIDNYLNDHRTDPVVVGLGKLGIVRSILEAEHNSKMMYDADNYMSKLKLSDLAGTWYVKLWQNLHVEVAKEDVKNIFANVAFVVFNYDRCIERFLYWALRIHYKLTPDEAADVMTTARIWHVYGSVGPLPYVNGVRTTRFGAQPEGIQLLEVSAGIRTFTEGVKDSPDIEQIRSYIAAANKLVFLGFAYLELNMKALAPNTATTPRVIYV